ncbi:DUF6968 family protein [Nocardia salmonicida]|uniref:DUF6968 family protein n=1 Tax=Nocardia salmonicida TaxID=53431 RepID=UPI003691AE7E
MISALDEVAIAGILTTGERELRVEIVDPQQDHTTQRWQCTYRVEGARAHRAHGPDRLAALYAALIDIPNAAARVGSAVRPTDADPSREPEAAPLRSGEFAGSATKAREFGSQLGARAVDTAAGPVVITIGRPRQDPGRPQTYLCPFRIDERTEAFAQGFDGVHAVMAAIREVGAILGIEPDWPCRAHRPAGDQQACAAGAA